MRIVELGGTSVRCSALGFGCVRLTVPASRAEAVRTLEVALEQGITHFDVARLYGFGQAEGILGEFLRGKRDRVTVTTKFGLRPPQSLSRHRRLIGLARQVLRQLPMAERLVKRRLAATPAHGTFTGQEAALSLDISLKELGTDHVDVFLMHEATPADAAQPELLDYLEEEVKHGRIRTYGLGSAAAKLGTDLAAFPPGCRVLQFDSTAINPCVKNMRHVEGRGLITFGVMLPLRPLLDYARREPARMRVASDQAQLDLTDPAVLSGLLIDDSLRANSAGVTLVSTVKPEHVAANARAASGQSFTDEQRAVFATMIQTVATAPTAPTAGVV